MRGLLCFQLLPSCLNTHPARDGSESYSPTCPCYRKCLNCRYMSQIDAYDEYQSKEIWHQYRMLESNNLYHYLKVESLRRTILTAK